MPAQAEQKKGNAARNPTSKSVADREQVDVHETGSTQLLGPADAHDRLVITGGHVGRKEAEVADKCLPLLLLNW
jgi:hypothetical protein